MAPESGYGLLEVMMAVFVSVIGLVSLLALFSQSVVTMVLVQEELIAKHKTREDRHQVTVNTKTPGATDRSPIRIRSTS